MIVDFATRTIRRILVGKEQRFVFTKKENIAIPPLSQIDLYIHIPFCRNKCPYCPYNRIDYDVNLVGPYTRAVLSEIEQYFLRLGKIKISSIYIGGGTPTTVIDELGVIIKSIREKFAITGDICIETTAGDLNEDIIRKLKDFGVDLISIGVQSFDDAFLKILGRNYDAAKACSAVNIALSSNFRSVNIDLMFALPGQNIANVLDDLNEALKIGANQVTTYPLFTFPYSSVGRYLKIRKVKMPGIFRLRKMYKEIHNFFKQNGYQRVSVWGFKKGGSPRFSSVTRDTYIGIGAGAGSRLPDVFYLNTFSVKDYIEATLTGRLPIALAMDMTPKLIKYYWLYWRFYDTCIDSQQLCEKFGKDVKLKVMFSLAKLLGLAKENGNQIELTERGAFYIHLLQNHFILNYIDRVWSAAMKESWPDKIEI